MEKETTVGMVDAIEQIVIDFGDICRFCLTETKNKISIHDKCFVEDTAENDEATIIDFVTKITSIKMDHVEGFPSRVCENCFSIIKICFEFRQSCQQSEYSLRDCYEKTLEEAKAKFAMSLETGDKGGMSLGDIVLKHEAEIEDVQVKVEDGEEISEDCNVNHEQYTVPKKDSKTDIDSKEIIGNNENKNVKLKVQKKQGLQKKDSVSVSVLKAGTIKQKYQRINSLSERLKEAQSKLVEDILRTKDIILTTSVKTEDDAEGGTCEKVRFSCPQCLISFPTPEMLTYHFITGHIAEKKNQRIINIFQCKMCKIEFSFMYQLMRHYKNMHKIPVSKLAADYLAPKNKRNAGESIKCLQCLDCQPPKVFTKRKDFLRHLSEHAKVEDSLKRSLGNDGSLPGKFYTCSRCDTDQTFATKFSLNRHLMNIHKLDRSNVTDRMENVVSSEDGLPQGIKGSVEGETANSDTKDLKLLKIYVCLDCSPPASFSDVALFIEHKSESHEKKLENMSLKELTPVYVEAVNVFQKGIEESCQSFKVVCKSCETPSEFYSASDFVEHMKSHHVGMPKEKWNLETKFFLDSFPASKRRDRIWKCTECPASYIRKHSLHYHVKEKHNKVVRVGCVKCPEPNCDASFFTNRQVIQHGLTVHEKYFANLHKVFKDKILHCPGETDKRVRNFECDICQKKYLGKTSLKRHILKTHLGKSDMENAICSYCGKTFSNNLNLKSHIDFVHEALFVSCPICKKNINFKTIGKHYKIHQASTEFEPESKNRFLCNQCGRVLKSKSGFDDHQKLHLNVRDQICDICGNGFTTKKNLYIHKKAHDLTQKKVFECDQCDKVFTGKHTLNRHLLTHSGEKNFICEICSKCFYTLQELNRHVRYHKKEYRFDCQLCDMRFLDRSRFRHHMMRHRNIRPHKCHFCDKVFIVRRKMNLHMAARHNVEVQNTKAIWKDPKTYIPLDDLL